MSLTDARRLSRTAQMLIVEARRCVGSPPAYEPDWQPVWSARVERMVIAAGAKSSTAVITFPDIRWDANCGLQWSDMVRIRSNEFPPPARAVIFCGFITSVKRAFAGGDEKSGAFERNSLLVADHRWLLAASSVLYGQLARSPDDYYFFGQPTQSPRWGRYTHLTGRRLIFNESGRPNRDADSLAVLDAAGGVMCRMGVFADPAVAEHWTARQMLVYVLSPIFNAAYDYFPLADPSALLGLEHPDFDKVLNHILVGGLNVMEAVETICRPLGWSFREEYYADGGISLVFYKCGEASAYSRSEAERIIVHRLYAPAAGETIDAAVAGGEKMLWSAEFDEDIRQVVNAPVALGAPDRFEFTAQLVPAWSDADFAPDTSEDNANLFFTDAELQEITDKNSKDYYKYYHIAGSSLLREVCRKWSLNETGRYSASPYGRGLPFDFTTVIPYRYILSSSGRRLFGPFTRYLLDCLTQDINSANTVGVKVEFSLDGGASWQVMCGAVPVLSKEAGIYIAEPNLALMVDESEATIEGGALDGVQLNYFTSLADDKVNGRSFVAGEWRTRVRVTASVQLDMRLVRRSAPGWSSGSPFWQARIYDFSERYGICDRTASSVFENTGIPAYQYNTGGLMASHLDAIRRANEDMSISGVFTLDRLWLGDGAGYPAFAVGDCIEQVAGRAYGLTAAFGTEILHPEIIQIVYLPNQQRQQLITRDLRFADMNK